MYVDRFDDLNKEFWYGLKPIYCLTNQGKWELRVDFTFKNGTKYYLQYNHFKIKSEAHNYPLSISGFTGITPADLFSLHLLNGNQSTWQKLIWWMMV